MFSRDIEEFIHLQRRKLMAEKQKLYICESTENEPMNQRYGEFSPNNPAMRVTTQPFLGLGEYDHRREMLMNQRKAEYAQHQYTEKVKSATDHENKMLRSNFLGSRPVSNNSSSIREKASQTDIQNVQSHLVQYEYRARTVEKAAPNKHGVNNDTHNNHNSPSNSKYGHSNMDAYGNAIDIESSPRARHMADLQSSCFPKIQGCPYVNTDAQEKAEKQRRQEKYQDELRQQIEEKQRLVARHKQEERQEDRKLELESQLRDINIDEKHGYGRRSYSSDTPLSARERMNKPERTFSKDPSTTTPTPRWHTDTTYRSRMLVDSSFTHHSEPTDNKFTSSKHSLNSSPPLHRRDLKKPYSFNIAANSVFANAFPVKHNITHLHSSKQQQQQLTKQTMNNDHKRMLHLLTANKTNQKLLDDSLPIPVLKTQYPVAKELKNAVVVHSTTSDAMRKLEDKWQIPAVQRHIIKSTPDRQHHNNNNNNNGILTQLGAIRLQLQQEQLRLDETLRKRGSSQTVIRADVHHNHN